MSAKTTCIVRGCTTSGTSEENSFFKLPKNDARLKSWLLVCHREDLLENESNIHNNHGICEQHFDPKYVSKTKSRTVLLPNACPTIFRKTKHKISDGKASIETPSKVFVASDKTLKNKKVECIDLTKEVVKTKKIKVKPNLSIQKSSEIRQVTFKRPIILRKTAKPQTKLIVSESDNASTSKLSGLVRIIPTNKPNPILCFKPVSTCVPAATVQPKPMIYFAPVNTQANNTTDVLLPNAVSTQEKIETQTTAKTYIAAAHNKLNVEDKNIEVFVLEKPPNFDHDSNKKKDSIEIFKEIMEKSRSQNKTITKETEKEAELNSEIDLVEIQDDFNSKSDALINVVETLNSDNVVNPLTFRIKSIGVLSSTTDPVNKEIQNNSLNTDRRDSTQNKKQTQTITAKTYIAAAHNKLSGQNKSAEILFSKNPGAKHDFIKKIDNAELKNNMEISSCQTKTVNKEIENKHVDDVNIHNSNTTVLTLEKEDELDSASNLEVQVQEDFNSENAVTNKVVDPFNLKIKNIGRLSSTNDSVNKGIQKGTKVITKKNIDSTYLKKIINKEIENKHVDDVKTHTSNTDVFTIENEDELDSANNLQDDFSSKNDATDIVIKSLNPDDANPFTLRIKSIDMLSSKNDSVNKGIQNDNLNKGKKETEATESQESILETVLQKNDTDIKQIKSSPFILNFNVTQRTAPLTERHQSYINQMFCTFSGCSTVRVDASSNFHHFPDEINRAIHWLVICKRPDILLKTRPEIKKFCALSVGVCSLHKEVIEKQIVETASSYKNCPWYKPPEKNNSQSQPMKSTVTEEVIDVDNYKNAYVPTTDKCAILDCLTCASDPIKKYRFPSDPDLLAEWRKAAGISIKLTEEQYRTLFVCRKHFDESQFTELGTLILTSVPHPHTEIVDPTAYKEKKKPESSNLPNKRLKNTEKFIPPKKNVCVVKHCGAVGPTSRLYSFPDPVKEQGKFLNWAKAVENRQTLTLQLMGKYAGAEICIKHFEKKYQIGGLFIKDNAIPSLDLVEGAPEQKQNTEQSTSIEPEFLVSYNFTPKQKIIDLQTESLESSYNLVPPVQIEPSVVVEPVSLESYRLTPEEENASGPVWKTCDSTVDADESSRDTLIRGNAKLYKNGIEFLNIKRALKYGKNCQKIAPYNFPYKVVRSKKSIRYGKQNLDNGFRMQIHTAIIVDDDDECEKEAIAAITRVITKNALIIPKRPSRRTNLDASNIFNK